MNSRRRADHKFPPDGFIGGWEAAFRFTYWGWHRRFEWIEGG